MPKKARKSRFKVARRASNRRRASANPFGRKHRRRTRKNPRTRVVVVRAKRSNRRHRRSSNPFSFFGGPARPAKVIEAAAGVLVGVAINKAALPLLPASLTGSTIGSTLSAFGVALAEWWLGSMVNPDFGAAVGLGGLANAGSQALNAFIPQVGSYVSLSGPRRGGVGDFVPGRFTVPQNPVMDANANIAQGSLMSGAYPQAYGM